MESSIKHILCKWFHSGNAISIVKYSKSVFQFRLVLEGNAISRNFSRVVLNRTSDVCRYLKQKKGSDFLMKIVYDILSQHGKFAQKCPVEKDVRYYFEGFELSEEMIPAFIPLRESFAILTMSYLILEKKKMVMIMESKVFVRVHIEWRRPIKINEVQ